MLSDEKPMAYLYLSKIFQWETEIFSKYKTFQSAFQVVAMLICIPVMSELFHWSDTVIMMVGAIAHSVARIVFALAPEAWWFFIGNCNQTMCNLLLKKNIINQEVLYQLWDLL